MVVTLLKPYGDANAGDQVDVADELAQHLIADGIADAGEADEQEVKDEQEEEVKDEAEEGQKDEDQDEEDQKSLKNIVTKRSKIVQKKLVNEVVKGMKSNRGAGIKPLPVANAVAKDKFFGIKDFNEFLPLVKHAHAGNQYAQNKLRPFKVRFSREELEGERLTRVKTPAGYAETTNSGADGGYAIPAEWTDKISDKPRKNLPDLFGMTSVQNVRGNTLHIPGYNETTETSGGNLSLFGGVTGAYSGEGVNLTPSNAKLNDKTIVLKKFYSVYAATNELFADDYHYDFLSEVQDKVGYFLLRNRNEGVVSGPGSTAPTGILNYTATLTVAKESGQAARTILFDNLRKMYSRLWPECEPNAVWLVNPQVKEVLMSMVFNTSSNTSAFGALSYSAHDPFPLKIFGKDVIPTFACPALGLAGDIILADLSQIKSAQKPLVVSVSEHIGFLTDETYFRFTDRHVWDIDGCWPDALTPRNAGTNFKCSPFIVLETRGS